MILQDYVNTFLSPPVADRFLRGIELQGGTVNREVSVYEQSFPLDLLCNGLEWCNTPEGEDYWHRVYLLLKYGAVRTEDL